VNPSSTFADKEIILRLLRRAEWRARVQRLAHELTFGFSLVLIIPIALKTWDLYSPLTVTAIMMAIGFSGAVFAAYAVSRIFRRGNLLEAAASVDEKAKLYDALTSASWFIRNQENSQWIDAQIEGTARNAADIDLPRLYPRRIPRTSYVAAVLLVFFVALNFIPLSLNHNWLKLQAAPAGIPPQPINQSNLDIDEALKEMAKDLLRSEKTESAAQALMQKQLQDAAAELRKLAEQLKERSDSSDAIQRMQQSLEQASKHSQPGLEKLSEELAEASQGLKNQDRESAEEALQNAASELEKLQEKMQPQKAKNGSEKQNEPRSSNSEQQDKGDSGQSKQASDQKSESESDGSGQDPAGTPPRRGERNTLEVQLEQERLAGMPSGGGIPEEVHESSKQQLSKLEYSNVKSELSAGRKDLMNKDAIPWEYRSLIKDYLQAIRPRE
jgi:hypothetical protein